MVMGVEQTGYLEHVDPAKIPSTVSFPMKVILDLCPDIRLPSDPLYGIRPERGDIWVMGFGGGAKAMELDRAGFTVGGYEVNKAAVVMLREQGDFFVKLGDARRIGDGGEEAEWDVIANLERVRNLLYEAVFPSLLGEQVYDGLWACDMLAAPGAGVFIADFIAANQVYAPLCGPGSDVPESVWVESASKWQHRYERNQEAFGDLGLPWRSFAVGKEGSTKLGFDWTDDPGLLREQHDLFKMGMPSMFERFASHLDLEEFELFITRTMGYEIVKRELVARGSRSRYKGLNWNVAPGIWWALKKPDRFRYHPWKQGLSPYDPHYWEKREERKGSPHRPDYWEDYFQTLAKTIPPGQETVFRRVAKRVGVSI